MKTKIFIVHFQPLEKYPPIINLTRFLGKQAGDGFELHIVSTTAYGNKKLFAQSGVVIHRLIRWKKKMGSLARMVSYFRFNLACFFLLLKHRPQKVLYFETLSAAAPFFYKKLIRRKAQIFVHYHEYTSPLEYRNGMILSRMIHRLEQKLYPEVRWISHTNEQRMNLFRKDNEGTIQENGFVLPNYPPQSWITWATRPMQNHVTDTRFVYVGALSLETTYLMEFAEFVLSRPDCRWDIYSDNFSDDVLRYFKTLEGSNVCFKGGVEYDDLPAILRKYAVGLILYKGHIPNYIYNAPNKLFEYMACGLDVWFPEIMEGCMPYRQSGICPRVLAVNFNSRDSLNSTLRARAENCSYQPSDYHAEQVLSSLTEQLLYHD